MTTLDEIGQEKQKISEQLARLDVEREKLATQLNELEVAERVMSSFGKSERRAGRPGRRMKAAIAPATLTRKQRAKAQPNRPRQLSVSDAVLRVVTAHPEGVSAKEALEQLVRDYGLSVRPNHLGIALQRHRRAGRLEQRDHRWYSPQRLEAEAAAD